MKGRPPALPWPRRPATGALARAHAVASWRRSLGRESAGAGGLRRFSAWARGVTGPPPSLLADEPLGILPDLVAERPARDEPDGGRSRRPALDTARAPGRARRGGGAGTARRRAGQAFAASVEAPAPPPGTEVARPRAALSRRRALPEPPAPTRRSVREPRPAAAHRRSPTLPHVIAGRAVARLFTSAPAGRRLLPVAGVEQPRAAAGTPAPHSIGVPSALAAQWANGLAGRAAPPELLLRLLAPPRSSAETPESAARERPAREAPTLPASRREPGAVAADAEPEAVGERSGLALEGPLLRRRTPPATAPPPPLTKETSVVASEPLHALAAEVPARGLGPRAEAAARLRVAEAESPPSTDDLGVLAAKVKRILDEEARRHGIDV